MDRNGITMDGKRFYRVSEVYKMLGFGRSWFYSHVSKGNIPQPIRVSNNASILPEDVVNEIRRRLVSGTLDCGAPYPDFRNDA